MNIGQLMNKPDATPFLDKKETGCIKRTFCKITKFYLNIITI